MFFAYFFTAFCATALVSLFVAPRFEDDYPRIKYITGYYPSVVRNFIGAPSSKRYQQTGPKSIINSNVPTKSDILFGDQQAAWEPVETYKSDPYDEFFYSNEYGEDAIHGWRKFNSEDLDQSEAILEPETEQDEETITLETENKDSESLRRICEALMLFGIDHKACYYLNQPIVMDKVIFSSPWTEVDEMGIRWKEVRDGKDKGCTYFIKADSVPLRVSATPKEDGTTKLSYFTKNTIGKYCPETDDPVQFEKFYQTLVDEIRPSQLTVFLNTRLFGEFTVYDLFEFHMLLDACIIAVYRNLSDGGPLSRKAFAGLLVLYTFAYSLYYVFFK